MFRRIKTNESLVDSSETYKPGQILKTTRDSGGIPYPSITRNRLHRKTGGTRGMTDRK